MWPSNRMTVREALESLAQFNIGLRAYGSLQYQLFYREDKHLRETRLIDNLEECVDVARDMRMERNEQQAGDTSFMRLAGVM